MTHPPRRVHVGRLISPLALLLAAAPATRADLTTWTLDVAGVTRTALVYAPAAAAATPSPVVFVFHGHGGSARRARRFQVDAKWPAAVVVYMQGIPIPIGKDADGARAGWQIRPGTFDDRDPHSFDAVLARLKATYRVDPKRVYATGMSNGGDYTYVLWEQRPDVFAAYAPASASTFAATFKPTPAIIQGGDDDPVVPTARQAQTMRDVRRSNYCPEDAARDWGGAAADLGDNDRPKLYPSTPDGTPVVTWVFHGGHTFTRPEADHVVAFVKAH